MSIELSVIIPTYNERENVGLLLDKLVALLEPVTRFEVLIADDDSPDKTWELVQQRGETDPRIRGLRRFGERGLAPAVIEGFHAAQGKYLAVMDADLQHDENLLLPMLEAIQDHDLVIGSRMAEGGDLGDWSAPRRFVSWVATKLAHWVLHQPIKDPMSGFFMLKTELFEQIAHEVDAQGFKILLEIMAHAPEAKVKELGYRFGLRQHGESKLNSGVIFDYLAALYRLKFGRVLPLSFFKYGLVGLSGVFVNLGLLFLLSRTTLSEQTAVILAIEGSMFSNYVFNNLWTFAEKRITDPLRFLGGFVKFNLISALGAVINFSVTFFLREQFGLPLMGAALFGISLATLWNFVFNRALVWRAHEH